MNVSRRVLPALSLLLISVAVAGAQTAVSGSIAGIVRDTSGAVLPGVTVEAASPALIEKVRTTVTDDQGRYRIVDLRPGAYTVTFTLPGFSTVRREGLELTTGFTAAVNADLRVGGVEETITVTGEAPVVDISNVRTQDVFSRDTIDALPVSKTSNGYAALLLGANLGARNQDVGGSEGDTTSSWSIHGNRSDDMMPTVDGMRVNRAMGTGGGFRVFAVNNASVQEMTFQTSGISAESETGGIQVNIVPREGGNIFSAYGATSYTNADMVSNNVSDELIARGLTAEVLKVQKIYDGNMALGGPVMRDRLWFYTAHRWWGTTKPLPLPGFNFNKNQGTSNFYTYEPDSSRPYFGDLPRRSHNIRLTWQAAERHKVNVLYDYQRHCTCPQNYVNQNATPEAMGNHQYTPHSLSQVSWNNPATNRLLFEGGFSYYVMGIDYQEQVGVGANDIAVEDLTTGYHLNSRAISVRAGNAYGKVLDQVWATKAAVSYVTGTHNFKTGFMWTFNRAVEDSFIHGDVLYRFQNGVPVTLVQWATPSGNDAEALNNGLFAQDQWTIQNLTLNLGVRFDYLNAWAPARVSEAGRWVSRREYDRLDDVPNFTDLSPRLGVAYDLFGNGRTALKAAMGRYVANINTDIARNNAPSWAEVTSTTRSWNDLNGDLVPQDNELGPSSNLRFGTRTLGTRSDEEVRTGFGNRNYNWQASTVLQHELRPGLGLNVGYYRTWYGNFSVTDNLAVMPADYDEYCITAPSDNRLPGGGSEICGLFDITPSKFGQVDNLITLAQNFGGRSEVYDGVDISLMGRLPNGAQLSGGVSTGQTVFDNCNIIDSPQQRRFCRTELPFEGQTQIKMHGVYPLAWDIQIAATFQDLPGIPIAANYTATSAQIAPSLGRNLASGARGRVTNIPLVEPNTMFEDRRRQLDLRFARSFEAGRTRVLGTFEIFNAFNANSIVANNATFGPRWLQPTEILSGRTLKVGAQFTF
ncbi:MAG: hypothetical protein A3F70_16635 [Acidobacteria bacterium RIFCSPLOWO2_12_FULL_67_14]|nr:MAG: hypothetical protein A3H29_19680 [Acidobacteria bacterium RIFCSPLOWO2_02_FULL_67_21]OFW36724.1 MAG: hypothetical protein A3F70_16635 [Acidobacteria bacterium RIFCSPLOWO2_12_FULL_67_14]